MLVVLAFTTACRTVHEPIVEAESIEVQPSEAEAIPNVIPQSMTYGAVDQMPHSSTGIVLLNPPNPRIDVSGSQTSDEDAESDEPETLLIREPWSNPVARGGVEAGDFGIRFEAVHFGYDSHDLDFPARQRLTQYSAWLEEHPDAWVTLEGHCDERGSSDYNYNLGMTRAWTAKDWLVSLGIDANRLHTISYGEEQPIALSHSPEAYAINRRVEFRPFYPTRNGRFLTSLKEGPDAPAESGEPVIPPPQPALKLHGPDASWPPLTE